VELTGDLNEDESLWAMLHYDLGVRGEFEFPGTDEPIRLPRDIVMTQFGISGDDVEDAADVAIDVTSTPAAEEMEATPTPAAEIMEATPTPTAAAEMAAPAVTSTPMAETEAPDMLPVTGASLSQESNSRLPWIAVILGVMVAAGIVIFRRRLA
jgi:hypothetical protein